MLRGLIRQLVFPRHLVPRPAERPASAHLEQRELRIQGGTIDYWLAPADAPGPRPTVFFAHGNGELIDQWVAPLDRYRALGAHLLLVEYRGYGRSAGRPGQPALTEDLLRVVALMCDDPRVDPRRLVYHGRSIGGGVVCSAARERPPAGLILQSTFTELHQVTRRFGAPRAWLPDRFDNMAAVAAFPGPCLIMHGDADSLIPPEHARQLQAAHGNARLRLFPGANHNTAIDRDRHYWEEIEALLSAV